MKMISRSIISTVCYPSTKQSKYSNCTVNPDQTRIFYKVGQTWMSRRKCDPGDPDDPTWFQPWYGCMQVYKVHSMHACIRVVGTLYMQVLHRYRDTHAYTF